MREVTNTRATGMRQGQGRIRRRQGLLHVAPLARSQSLDAITTSLGSTNNGSRRSSDRYGVGKGDYCANPRGPHLPPLGRNQQQSLVSYPTRHLVTKAAHRTTASGLSRAGQVGDDWPGSGPERKAVANVFVQAGQAAGIAFQWVETPTAGLSVVGVAGGSVAARHGGVTAGMLLVEINRQRVAGMEQEEVTRVVRTASTQPRVLTLARIAPSAVATAHRGSYAETRPEDTIVAATEGSLALDSPLALSSFIEGDGQTSVIFHQPLSHQHVVSSGPRPVSSSSDGDMLSAKASRSTSSSATNQSAETTLAPTGSRHLVSQERTLALRFVGSRGDITLFDRDHVLGLKKRDIEFVPSGSRSKMLLNNSRRSLGELTRDWRNDPCSTPARRRRLINDVCKAIVRSYTHASVLRVTELRREEVFAARIQSAARMRSARSRYTARLADRRRRGAVTLQLGWLSYRARRWVAVLRDERDHAIRLDDVKRKIRLAHEKQARHRCEEARRLAEEAEMEREKRCREQHLVVLLQRRYRTRKEQHNLIRVEQVRDQRREMHMLHATIVVQSAFRHALARWRRQQRLELRAQRSSEGVHAASLRLQQAWRRHKATVTYRRAHENCHSRASSPSTYSVRNDLETLAARPTDARHAGKQYPSRLSDGHHAVLVTPISSKNTQGDGADSNGATALGWESWSPDNSALVAEISREGERVASSVVVEDARPKTAAGVVESTRTRNAVDRPPPAGMMTVRIRRGSEESSLVTPIVLTENGDETPEPATGADDGHGIEQKAEGGPPGTLVSETSLYAGDNNSRRGQRHTLASAGGVQEESALFYAHERQGGGVTVGQETTAAVQKAQAMLMLERKHPSRNEASYASANLSLPTGEGIISATPPFSVDRVGEAATAPPLQTASVSASVCSSQGETATTETASTSKSEANVFGRSACGAKHDDEHFFMEDSQVYLGCTMCGVKYLVEAVDPRLPTSTQGQPAPEVLYLCTTCGGTLRNSEDGRWRRRRRPSSAPAAGRRSSFFDGGKRRRPEGFTGEPGATTADGSAGASKIGRQGGGETAKLRYAHNARRIQQAFRDFRHRQYLRDWASSLLHRWLLGRVRARRRSHQRLRARRAAVKLQAAARAAFARARCSALRAARLRFWIEKADRLFAEEDLSPSPVAAELLRELNTPPLPPPPQSKLRPSEAPGSGGRALAEALAPRMGRPPPGCPDPLEVDWGEWGVKLKLVFPPRVDSNPVLSHV